ncbi:RhoGAP-domain-containing protein [Punctularia strigosozonata HHB-11173 SS5]|uniref:RhoGAP-domain-containing protein n=1 Tax=Punctularia strigosozonata (strain HHB-11173) TaxID=741275 RepID=UPI0004416C0C|nr:RhoGAP-domain-containing protein [Punctularia strigosozonata HHB-11173 SS5]EIN11622.1 RhoGAP-domain-containing protein [Punctularia strigosozonata HHB-11173 SS5]
MAELANSLSAEQLPEMDQNSVCPGCKKSVLDESGGVVVAFGQSFFHVDCFRCAKCGEQVTADTNLLLLSDGSPICSNCSYGCAVCGLPILDEAIMTGDDSYHAHCFKCKVCQKRIDELVFAKTRQGIYCMDCHNARVARSRRHAQRQKEKQRAAVAAANGQGPESPAPRENGAGSPAHDAASLSSDPSKYSSKPPSRDGVPPPFGAPGPATRRRSQLGPGPTDQSPHPPHRSQSTPQTRPRELPTPPPLHPVPSTSSAPTVQGGSPYISVPDDNHNNTLPMPSYADAQDTSALHVGASNGDKRKSFDDGVRPLNVLFGGGNKHPPRAESPDVLKNTTNGIAGMSALQVPDKPTSRRDKRNSINPGLSLANMMANSIAPVGTRSPPTYSSPLASPPLVPSRSNTPPVTTRIPSPLRDRFPDGLSPPIKDYSSQPNTPAGFDQSPYSRSRAGSSGAIPDLTPQRPPLRTNNTLERVPPRNASLAGSGVRREPPRPIAVHRISSEGYASSNGRLSPALPGPIRAQRSFDERSRGSIDGRLSPNGSLTFDLDRSRPASQLSHRSASSRASNRSAPKDLPRGVESGTDTDNEHDDGDDDDVPPAPPPKSAPRTDALTLDTSALSLDLDLDASLAGDSSGLLSGGDQSQTSSAGSSSPVERTSHATYIAPALPPIRFSMSGTDFSEWAKNVGSSGGKLAEQLGRLTEEESIAPDGAPVNGGGGHKPQGSVSSLASMIGGAISLPEVDKTPTKRTHATRTAAAPSAARSRSSSEAHVGSEPAAAIAPSGLGRAASLSARITVTAPEPQSEDEAPDPTDVVTRRLKEIVADAREKGLPNARIEVPFLQALLDALVQRETEYASLKSRVEGMKRASKQYVDGLTVAQAEYDKELKARRDAEAEVSRLRVLLSGQAARISAMQGAVKKQEVQQELSEQLTTSISGLAQDLSKLRVERDMTLAEVEELSASKSTVFAGDAQAPTGTQATRSLSMRLDKIKGQYQRDLVTLTEQKETLAREIAELKASRELYLEETSALNARNEELAKLSAQYVRRVEEAAASLEPEEAAGGRTSGASFDKPRDVANSAMSHSATSLTASSTAWSEETTDTRFIKVSRPDAPDTTPQIKKIFKWPGPRAAKEQAVVQPSQSDNSKSSQGPKHAFQQINVLRFAFARCDHCGDKMFGTQFRCTNCHFSAHTRCINAVHGACPNNRGTIPEEPATPLAPPPPSMFGRDLIEQVRDDAARSGTDRLVPFIVEKCIDAVEHLGMDWEGIYRKTGGSGQQKMLTQLFERGDYQAFDLLDTDRFNDIASVTSVLKTYFRSLPNPLMSYDLHDEFMQVATIKEQEAKVSATADVVDRLPDEHYHTLRMLILHLHRVRLQSDVNLMGSRNLGVVFGPTLMRSRDPSQEFSDMAGKAQTVECLVEYAPIIFGDGTSE